MMKYALSLAVLALIGEVSAINLKHHHNNEESVEHQIEEPSNAKLNTEKMYSH